MLESLRVLCGVVIVGSMTFGIGALFVGGAMAIAGGGIGVAAGGAALVAFGTFFGTWYTKHLEDQAPENQDHTLGS